MDGGAGQDSGQGSEGPGDRSFGGYLLASARSIIADARQSITDEKLTDAEAVHDVRKALKRWRALMRLLSGPLKDQAERMRVEARDLMRRLAGARDAQAGLVRRDNQDGNPATIRMRMRRCWGDEGRA